MRLGSRNSNVYEIIREKIQPNKKEWNWNIQWTEDLIRNYYNDEEFPVVSYVFIMIVLFMMIIHSFNDRTLSYFISKTSIYFSGTMIQIRVIWWWIGMISLPNHWFLLIGILLNMATGHVQMVHVDVRCWWQKVLTTNWISINVIQIRTLPPTSENRHLNNFIGSKDPPSNCRGCFGGSFQYLTSSSGREARKTPSCLLKDKKGRNC